MNISRTTIVLYGPEPDAHVLRLRRLDQISDFATAPAVLRLTTQATLRAGVTLHANGIVSVGATGTRLNTRAPLAADTTVAIGTEGHLPLANPLAAAARVSVETAAPLTIIPTLAAVSLIPLSSVPARLTLGGVPLGGQAQIHVATTPRLSRVQQFFAAQPRLHLQTNAALQVQGQSATDVLITFNGAATGNVRLASLSIEDVLNEAPNTCTFIVDQRAGPPPPAIGTDVRIGLRDTTVGNVLFAGTVKTVEPYYERAPTHPAWAITCEDYTFLINRRRVFGTWTTVSATTVALEILSRFTAGFSTAGIVAGLPPIKGITFRGETVMDALTQIANLIGGYAGGPDYNRVVWLFVTDPRLAPDPVTAGHPLLMIDPPVRQTLDLTQTRTRVVVQGAGVSVGGPPDCNIDSRFGQLPLADSHIFAPGTGGQVITDDAQILSYVDVLPGQQAAIVKGNVPPPAGPPVATIAPATAGELQGRYLWKVAFANANGETEAGPPTFPPLLCEPFPTPGFPFPTPPIAISPAPSLLGPLVGTYTYVVTFLTSKGETGPSLHSTRTATATPPPVTLLVQDALVTGIGGGNAYAPGPLAVGATYGYHVAYTTVYGETAPHGPVVWTPAPLPGLLLESFTQNDFGGLQGNADYVYGASFVTALGESAPTTFHVHTASYAGLPGFIALSGFSDFNGRIAAGNYAWAASYYHDQFGETFLSAVLLAAIGAAPPGASGVRVGIRLPGLSARADGLRLYRGFQGGNPWALVADLRRGDVGAGQITTLDFIAQTEGGNPWPVHPLRGGGIAMSFLVWGSQAGEVVARRLYRSKANGTELFLIAELQHNQSVNYLDQAPDTALSARGPVTQTTGHRTVITMPGYPFVPGPTGYVGRRLYRTKANGTAYYRLADLTEMTSSTFVDTTPDESLTAAGPANPSTAGGEAHLLQSIPIGPTGTLGRRIYRTVANGVELHLLVQIGDNTTTTFLDAVPDTQVGNDLAPLVNTAGAAAVLLSQVPIGPATVTQRHLYRTKAIRADGGGSTEFFYVGTVNNNVETTFIDDKADRDLGRPPVATATIGALAGDTSLVLSSAAGWPLHGWVEADSQVLRYDGISYSGSATRGDTLLAIPPLLTVTSLTRSGQTATAQTASAHGFVLGQRVVVLGAVQPEYTGTRTITALVGASGFSYVVTGAPLSPATAGVGQTIVTSAPGALTGALAGGTTVLTVPMLVGVSGIGVPVQVGSPVNLWVVRNATAGQQALAALEGGDGIHEFLIQDGDLDTIAACAARGDAELLQFQDVGVSIAYTTRDRKTRSGALVSITLPTPAVSGSFRIQRVRIDQIDLAARLYPRYAVTCSTTKFSLTDLLRHVVLAHTAA